MALHIRFRLRVTGALDFLRIAAPSAFQRCGLISLAAQTRCTLAGETPTARAIERTLQRVRLGGELKWGQAA